VVASLSESIIGLDFGEDGLLYGTTVPDIFVGGPSRLVTINTETGAINDIGAVGFNTVTGIVFEPDPIKTPVVPVPPTFILGLVGIASMLGYCWLRQRKVGLSQ